MLLIVEQVNYMITNLISVCRVSTYFDVASHSSCIHHQGLYACVFFQTSEKKFLPTIIKGNCSFKLNSSCRAVEASAIEVWLRI